VRCAIAFKKLSDGEKATIFEVLTVVLRGSYIEDFEFQTRLGFERPELKALIEAWPNIDDRDDESFAVWAIHNCFNEVCNGFYIPPGDWAEWFTVAKPEVENLFVKWIELRRSPKQPGSETR